MELGKLALEAALKAISYTQLDVRKTYKLQRKLDRVGQLSLTRLHCRAVDMEIKREFLHYKNRHIGLKELKEK